MPDGEILLPVALGKEVRGLGLVRPSRACGQAAGRGTSGPPPSGGGAAGRGAGLDFDPLMVYHNSGTIDPQRCTGGHTRFVSVHELRTGSAHIAEELGQGQQIVLTPNGKPCAPSRRTASRRRRPPCGAPGPQRGWPGCEREGGTRASRRRRPMKSRPSLPR